MWGEKQMEKLTLLKLMELGGIPLIVVGLLLLVVYTPLEFIGPIYAVIGILMITLGVFWIVKVRSAIRREKAKAKLAAKKTSKTMYIVLALLIAASGLLISNVVHLQTFSPECYVMYRRVVYVEYFAMGLLIISGFLAFAPIILGRTILGPILQELQYIAGAMMILLIFALLVIFPLDPMFVMDNPQNPTMCYVDVNRLQAQGPPLMQILLKLFTPPYPPT